MAQPKLQVANEIKIDKGVPVPRGRGIPGKYPWAALTIGDSFFVAGGTEIRSGLYTVAARHKIKISVHTATENGAKGVRVWRVA